MVANYRSVKKVNLLLVSRELGHSATILQCHLDLGSLHLQEVKPGLALRYFRDALSVASEQHSWQQEAEVYREMGQVHSHGITACAHKVFESSLVLLLGTIADV